MAPASKSPFQPFVLITAEDGVNDIPQPTPLKRLHYFDGKFLRADDLSLEQRYVRSLVHLSNQAGGTGVVHGLDTTLSAGGGAVEIGPGMAIDPAGRLLLLPGRERSFDLADLIERSSRRVLAPKYRFQGPGSFEECEVVNEAPATTPTLDVALYLITLGHAEALCGEEDVYGKICEEACITSTDRPYAIEGVVVRAVPLVLPAAMPGSSVVLLRDKHLRSRVASAIFAGDLDEVPSFISGSGLRQNGWCLGARLGLGATVPLAVVGRAGETTVFFDAWPVRRERMDAPARRYWAGRLAMRAWHDFLAQVLQFQCHLHELYNDKTAVLRITDPCDEAISAARDAGSMMEQMLEAWKTPELAKKAAAWASTITNSRERIARAIKGGRVSRRHGVLIDGGIVELPPAGYLPIGVGVNVNEYAAEMFGPGVDFRVCRVTPDFVGHALEEAQHMRRISLLDGLDKGGQKPQVDVLVPDGEILQAEAPAAGIGFEGTLHVRPELAPLAETPVRGPAGMFGAGAGSVDMAADMMARAVDDAAARRKRQVDEVAASIRRQPSASAIAAEGAGRGERLADGGAAFYFAATTEASNKIKAADLGTMLFDFGKDKMDDAIRTFSGLPQALAKDQAERISGKLYQKAIKVGGQASAHRYAMVREMVPADGEDFAERVPGYEVMPTFEFPTAASDARVVSAYVGMRADRNLFASTVRTSSPVALHLAVGLPGKPPTWVEYRLLGNLQFTQLQTAGSIITAVGTIEDGSASMRGSIDGGEPISIHFDSPITLKCRLDRGGETPSLVVKINHGQAGMFSVSVRWSTDPAAAQLEVHYLRKNTPALLLASGGVTENPSVLAAGHPRHLLAESAVQVLASLLKRPSFAEQALALLFPPAPPAPTELQLRSTRDWIFFHRRRLKDCGEPRRVEAAPSRRYEVWQLEVPDDDAARRVRDALLAQATPKVGFSLVGAVEFAGGAASFAASPVAFRQDWLSVERGNILQYALIASNGSLDGDAIARARLEAVEGVLGQILTPADNMTAESVAFVPPALAAPDTDGSILLVTRTKVAKTCHRVFVIAPHYKAMAVEMIDRGDFASLGRIVTDIGELEFEGDSSQWVTNEAGRQQVVSEWTKSGTIPDLVIGLANDADTVASNQHLGDRVKAIAQLLGADNRSDLKADAVPWKMPSSCGGATFIVPRVTKHKVYAIAASDARMSKMLQDRLLHGDIKHILSLDQVKEVGWVWFHAASARNAGIDNALSQLSDKFPGLRARRWTVVGQPGHRWLEPLAVQRAQAAAVIATAEAGGNLQEDAALRPPLDWADSDVHHITFLYDLIKV